MASTPSCATSGSTICCTALVPVSVISINTKFNIPEPTNQTVATEIVQEILQADSTIATATNQGSQTIQATYNIEATLCLPSSSTVDSHPQTIQILTHALGTGKKYWDIAPGYSYVNAAVAAGYATLAYNKLGCGQSDHPDPIEVVQTSIDVEILHGLIQILRQGALGYSGFKHIIGVGHSYGSIVQLADNAKYPADVDATVLTGFVNNGSNVPFTLSTNNPAIAAINNPSAFGGLPTGYVVDDTRISVQQPFFRFPFFDNSIFEIIFAARQPFTIGQLLTFNNILKPAPAYTGPVDLVVGQHDFPFCLGECDYPDDQAAASLVTLYPSRSPKSVSLIIPNSGHYINAQYQAPMEFAQINNFIKSNGF